MSGEIDSEWSALTIANGSSIYQGGASSMRQGPPLIMWINFNPNMDQATGLDA